MKVEVRNVTWEVGAQKIVDNVSLVANRGEFVGLIGPNGSGKTSLLRLICRILRLNAGHIELDGRNIWSMSAKEMAQHVAVVSQERNSDFDFTVSGIVAMGRSPHKGLFEADTPVDECIVQESLAQVGLAPLALREFRSLSGGEMQRTLVARALAQRAEVLILDEPTNHLDIRHQFEVLDLALSIKVTTIAALHDLNLAARYCQRLYLMSGGKVVAYGTPSEVLTCELIRSVYGVDAEVQTRDSNRPHIIYNGLVRI